MLEARSDRDGKVYRRGIRLRARPGRVFAEVEDNPHHFQVRARHDGRRIVTIDGAAPRYPWTSCPGAAEPLKRLVGMELSPRCTSVGQVADARSQCTHLFDLAGLAVAHAHAFVEQGRERRDYACEVMPDPATGHTRATLARDGEPLLEWFIDGDAILRPAPFAGARLHARFMSWAEGALDLETAEAALVLRRACFVAPSRHFDFDGVDRASQLANMLGRCHTFSPGTVETSLRMHGSTRAFEERNAMLEEPEPSDW